MLRVRVVFLLLRRPALSCVSHFAGSSVSAAPGLHLISDCALQHGLASNHLAVLTFVFTTQRQLDF